MSQHGDSARAETLRNPELERAQRAHEGSLVWTGGPCLIRQSLQRVHNLGLIFCRIIDKMLNLISYVKVKEKRLCSNLLPLIRSNFTSLQADSPSLSNYIIKGCVRPPSVCVFVTSSDLLPDNYHYHNYMHPVSQCSDTDLNT